VNKKLDLLDLGVSFAAQVPADENGIAFAFYGLAGGYLGQWSVMSYYEKVNEYVNSESRDIWEYDLALNKEETESVLRHVWELDNNSFFFYYFLDENCSYQLLALLEVVKPDWDLTFFPIYVIPAETVKKVAQVPGAITQIKYRPSHQKKMFQLYDGLDANQRKIFFKIINGPNPDKIIAETTDVKALDASSAYLFYQKQKDVASWPKDQSDILRTILVRRSELGAKTASVEEETLGLPEELRPDLGHYTYKFGVGSGTFGGGVWGSPSGQSFSELSFRFAYHDLMNDDRGYPSFSQIEFPGVILRQYPSQNTVSLEKLEGLGLVSLSPISFIESHPSYEFDFNFTSPKDLCVTCHILHGEGGGGDPRIISHIVSTQSKLGYVITSFDDLRKLIAIPDEKLDSGEVQVAFEEVVKAVYENFNILQQRDTFLATEMATFLAHDYSMKVHQGDQFNDYQQNLLVTSGKDLWDKVMAANSLNAADAYADLTNALDINKNNIEGVEMLMGDALVPLIEIQKMRADRTSAQIEAEKTGKTPVKPIDNREIKDAQASRWWQDRWACSIPFKKSNDDQCSTIFNHDLYPAVRWMSLGNLIHGNSKGTNNAMSRSEGDLAFGTTDQILARLCIQSLAFNTRARYFKYCQNTELKAPYSDDDPNTKLPRTISYNALYYKRGTDSRVAQICAIRDYSRNNYVYSLEKEFELRETSRPLSTEPVAPRHFIRLGNKAQDALKKHSAPINPAVTTDPATEQADEPNPTAAPAPFVKPPKKKP